MTNRRSFIELQPGDICEYSFGAENASRCKVRIVRILNSPRSIAEINVLDVFVDDSGNDYFHYLQRTGNTMNASLKYLKKITEV